MSRYDELPFFRVEMAKCERKCSASYGILPYCGKTGRYCMVRSRESWSYITFLRGVYHLCYVKTLVDSLTQEEYSRLLRCIEDIDYLEAEMKRINLQSPKKYLLKYTSQRLQDARELILSCPVPQVRKLPYSASKGQLKKGEDPLTCAYREFFEESGVRLEDYPHVIVENFEESTYKTATGLPYASVIYLALFDEEFPIPDAKNYEVAKVKWVTQEVKVPERQ